MNRKAIFLDIDGTLVNEHNQVPKSAKEAIKKARSNGHYVFLCTGRASSEVVGEVAELELDGWVCAAGAYVKLGDKVIEEKYISTEDLQYVLEYMDKHDFLYCLESPNGVFTSEGVKAFFEEMIAGQIAKRPECKAEIEKGVGLFVQQLREGEATVREDINKITFFDAAVNIETMIRDFEDRLVILPSSMTKIEQRSGEIMMQNVHKASGIQKVLEYLQLDRRDSMAYGDSYNDLEMIEFVHTGVAMGNACEALKKVADDIADSVDQDGISKSFEKYDLV